RRRAAECRPAIGLTEERAAITPHESIKDVATVVIQTYAPDPADLPRTREVGNRGAGALQRVVQRGDPFDGELTAVRVQRVGIALFIRVPCRVVGLEIRSELFSERRIQTPVHGFASARAAQNGAEIGATLTGCPKTLVVNL